MKRKVLVWLVLIAIFAAGTGAGAATSKMIEVYYNVNDIKINGESAMPSNPDNNPFIYNGTTYVPLRFVSQELGETVKWDGATKTITIGGPSEGAGTVGNGVQYLTYQQDHFQGQGKLGVDGRVIHSDWFSLAGSITSHEGKSYGTYLALGFNSTASKNVYYELAANNQYRTMTAELAIVDETKNRSGTGQVNIYADGRRVASETIQPGMRMKNLSVNVNDADVIKVEYVSMDGYPPSALLGNLQFNK
ncbi:stalk domain-containing protein [Alkalicoccus urumqiensis]|uniref:stalk domain-containing protein n=1 Tax=Alkalicoccus urumqiensis TaxID=1548213 RepID=UPI0015E5E9D8|nr:stalk domain-containing protein [Alkalicoccus urumqiensis]